MLKGVSNGKSYHSREQYAYIPAGHLLSTPRGRLGPTEVSKCEECLLALWMMIHAFKTGKLFSIGTSVTHGTFGIVFGGIHMKSQMTGGLSNHGYGYDPIKELKETVLQNLISECNSVNIFYT